MFYVAVLFLLFPFLFLLCQFHDNINGTFLSYSAAVDTHIIALWIAPLFIGIVIVVAGSSSVTPVMENLKEAYAAVNAGAEIEINESDSTTGMTSTMEGICDIGMASRDLKEDEAKELDATVIANDGIAVIVNNNSTVEELTSEQVKSIFVGDVLTWDEIVK